ncbi:hypothetical protein CLU79DRAFT_885805 [Phycomyces nitens]|nr:hypothetical protein CLU79DRAFT_885805 [Phycomyces nitens]
MTKTEYIRLDFPTYEAISDKEIDRETVKGLSDVAISQALSDTNSILYREITLRIMMTAVTGNRASRRETNGLDRTCPNLTITTFVDETTARIARELFPDYTLHFNPQEIVTNPRPYVLFHLATEHALSMFGSHDLDIIHLGGNPMSYAKRQPFRSNVHCCVDESDIYVRSEMTRMREELHELEEDESTPNKKRSHKIHANMANLINNVGHGLYCDQPMLCLLSGYNMLVDHTKYDLSLEQIGLCMIRHSVKLTQGFFPYSPEMIYADTGYLFSLDAKFIIDREEDTITIEYNRADQFTRTYRYSNYVELYSKDIIRVGEERFKVERNEPHRGNIVYYKIARLSRNTDIEKIPVHRMSFLGANQMCVLRMHMPKKSDPESTRKPSFELVEHVVHKSIYSVVYNYALRMAPGKLNFNEINNHLYKITGTQGFNMKSIFIPKHSSVKSMYDIAKAIYFRAYCERFMTTSTVKIAFERLDSNLDSYRFDISTAVSNFVKCSYWRTWKAFIASHSDDTQCLKESDTGFSKKMSGYLHVFVSTCLAKNDLTVEDGDYPEYIEYPDYLREQHSNWMDNIRLGRGTNIRQLPFFFEGKDATYIVCNFHPKYPGGMWSQRYDSVECFQQILVPSDTQTASQEQRRIHYKDPENLWIKIIHFDEQHLGIKDEWSEKDENDSESNGSAKETETMIRAITLDN